MEDNLGCTNCGRLWSDASYLWALSVVLLNCHPTGAYNFYVAPRVFGKFVKTWANCLLF
jgi:hypothetical protein